MLVLRALQLEAIHGWGTTEGAERGAESVLQRGQRTPYPAPYRLERQALIQTERRLTANNRRAPDYRPPPRGRRHRTQARAAWRRTGRANTLWLAATLDSGGR